MDPLCSLPRNEADVLQARYLALGAEMTPRPASTCDSTNLPLIPFLTPSGGDLLLLYDLDSARAVPGGVDLGTGVCRGVDSL